MKRIFWCSLIFLLTVPVSGYKKTHKMSFPKAGSISLLNVVLLLDSSAHTLAPAQTKYMHAKFKEGIAGPYYYCYTIPGQVAKTFIKGTKRGSKLTDDDIEKLAKSELLPRIIELLEAGGKEIKNKLSRKVQRRIFIKNRRKKLGISSSHMQGILNSEYLFIPFISNVAVFRTGEGRKGLSWTFQSLMGIIFYEFSTKGKGQYTAKLRVKTMKKAIGIARDKAGQAQYKLDGKTVTPKMFAFMKMVQSGVEGLSAVIQEIGDFRVSGKILKWSKSQVWLEGGKGEGIQIDGKYLILEQRETNEGKNKKANGWVLVTRVGKRTGKKAPVSKAKIIGGRAGPHNFFIPYARLPIDIRMGYKMFPLRASYKRALEDSLVSTGKANGLEITGLWNMGRWIGINQMFLGFSYGFGIGSAVGHEGGWAQNEGSTHSYSLHQFGFPLFKRFYFRRFSAETELSFSIQQSSFDLVGTNYAKVNRANGFSIGLGAGFALFPSLQLHGGIRYQISGESCAWKYLQDGVEKVLPGPIVPLNAPVSYKGLGIKVGISWSPPTFSFRRRPKE